MSCIYCNRSLNHCDCDTRPPDANEAYCIFNVDYGDSEQLMLFCRAAAEVSKSFYEQCAKIESMMEE